MFALEDDSQAGPDHVDSHRSLFLAISAYNHPGTIHRFVNTTDVVAAIEDILGLGRMSKFDYFSRCLSDVFSETPSLAPYKALVPQTDMKEMNPTQGAAAQMSERLDLRAADRSYDAFFNQILWFMLKPGRAVPTATVKSPLHTLQVARRFPTLISAEVLCAEGRAVGKTCSASFKTYPSQGLPIGLHGVDCTRNQV